MSTRVMLENQHVTVYYHEDTKIVHEVYGPTIGGENLREALNTGIDVMREQGACKWLSDNRQVPPLSEEDTNWINTEWVRNAISVGWKYWSLLVPEDVMAQMNLREIVEEFYSQGVRIMVFTDPDEAMEWLITVDQSN